MPGWWSSGKSTPQSMMSRRPRCSTTVMLRPISPRPPSGTTRTPPSARGPGSSSSGWGWLIGCGSVARAERSSSRCSGGDSTSGSRTVADSMTPSSTSAALAMIAPCEVVMSASTTGISEVWMARASARSPRSTAATIAAYCSPATWPTTETTPVAPRARSGRLTSSAPLNQSRSVAAMTWVEAQWSPLASLTAAMLGCSARRDERVGGERDAGARGDVVEHHREVRWCRRRPGSARRGRPGWACCSTA